MISIPRICGTVPKPSAVLEGLPKGGDTLMTEFWGAGGGLRGGWENCVGFVSEPETSTCTADPSSVNLVLP